MSKEFKSGDLVTFRDAGKYEVVKRDAKRYTIYTIRDIDRGQGWCELTQTYKGVRNSSGWFRGQNYSYDEEIITHRSKLKLI
tara:strand:- start:406 stop:651 length:246 start_codon:yes stop_codon:yes gene_type:complete